ncbi:MAG: DNA-binding protein, partial [Alphaproteobacteria bacterium]
MNDPSKQSPQYDAMALRWALPSALMGGTLAMRAAGSRFLPRHPAENAAIYAERARRAVLRNYFRRTVQKLTGRVFAEPLIVGEETPDDLVALFRDIDTLGRGLNAFARDWFEDALVHGLSHVLVDFPAAIEGDSLAEERALGARPYAVHIRAEQLIAAQLAKGEGRDRLQQIRIRESICRYDGFEEVSEEQIRVLEPDHWRLYRQDKAGKWIE